jgi:hypothetical protein
MSKEKEKEKLYVSKSDAPDDKHAFAAWFYGRHGITVEDARKDAPWLIPNRYDKVEDFGANERQATKAKKATIFSAIARWWAANPSSRRSGG